jgi:hypothetical protein
MTWAIVAHSEGALRGVMSPDHFTHTELGDFCVEMALAGCTLQPVADEDSYIVLLSTLQRRPVDRNASRDCAIASPSSEASTP